MVTVVTLDGPTSSGKGTISRMVAAAVRWHLLDSGALYRLVALAGQQLGLEPDNIQGHAAAAQDLDARFGAVSDEEQIWLAGVEKACRRKDGGRPRRAMNASSIFSQARSSSALAPGALSW